jgi:hypothetical protein
LPTNPRSRRRTTLAATNSQTKIHTTSAMAANPVPKVYASVATRSGAYLGSERLRQSTTTPGL